MSKLLVFLGFGVFLFLLGYVTFHHVRGSGSLLGRLSRWIRDVVDLVLGL